MPARIAPRRSWFGPYSLGLLGLILILVELFRQANTRPETVVLDAPSTISAPDPRVFRLLELHTGVRFEGTNRVEVLLNGDGTYPQLWRDLASASRTITVQMYFAMPGKVADTLAAILCARASHGVRALMLLDAFGAVPVPRAWLEEVGACGVEVHLLRPLRWHTLHSSTSRSHVRAVVVDGRIGYTGGFGIADQWFGGAPGSPEWRETNVRFTGPSVAALQAAFAAAWTEATGEILTGEDFFPAPVPVDGGERPGEGGRAVAGVLFTAPTIGSTGAERFLALAIRSARTRLYITNPYFVPTAGFRRLLNDAGDRGVDVRVLTAGPKTDVTIPWLAARAYYDELRVHGVRVYEYQPAMMHAKTIVVDGAWGAIGSMNFDSRSLAYNDEVNLVVLDTAFGARMDAVFLADLAHAREMTPTGSAARRWWEHALGQVAVLLSHLL